MNPHFSQLGVGRGIYSVPEARMLTGVSSARIRGWLRGYQLRPDASAKSARPAIQADYAGSDGSLELSFLDLVEVRVVSKLLDVGISWREIRRAASAARDLLSTNHPFASQRLKTDGRHLFAEIAHAIDEPQLLHLAERQQIIRKVIDPGLQGIEFVDSIAHRWWPLSDRFKVVIDPARSFGRPIASLSGVPTQILARAVQSQSVSTVASWYEVTAQEVRDAIRFERQLAA